LRRATSTTRATRRAMPLRAANFAESGGRRKNLQEAFGIGRSTLKQVVNKFRAGAAASA